MKKTDALFLAVLRHSLQGEKANIGDLSPNQWRELLQLAQTHKLLPMFLEAVYDCPSFQCLEPEERSGLKRQIRQQVVLQTMRTAEFLELNKQLRKAGIRPLVVKGLICRSLYPKPDQRPSGDEDVLVSPAQFEACRGILQGLGMESAGEEDRDAYEIPFRKSGSPLYIELHRSLFPPKSKAYGHLNRFFAGVFDRAVELDIQGNPVLTLSPTDHLFYLICHAFKHFLHSGFGIRQVCDMVLFARRYGVEVDWQQVVVCCEAIRGLKFAAAIFRIGEKHLGIPAPEAFRKVQVDEGPMLSDLLGGGLYGDATLSRKHSSSITLDAVAAEKLGKRPRGALRTSLFPPAEAMARKYPHLKEKPWLLPVAWGQRIWKYCQETLVAADSSAAEALKIGAERVELMKQYEILDMDQ